MAGLLAGWLGAGLRAECNATVGTNRPLNHFRTHARAHARIHIHALTRTHTRAHALQYEAMTGLSFMLGPVFGGALYAASFELPFLVGASLPAMTILKLLCSLPRKGDYERMRSDGGGGEGAVGDGDGNGEIQKPPMLRAQLSLEAEEGFGGLVEGDATLNGDNGGGLRDNLLSNEHGRGEGAGTGTGTGTGPQPAYAQSLSRDATMSKAEEDLNGHTSGEGRDDENDEGPVYSYEPGFDGCPCW